jgi:transcriptional regulator with GAF, ATPase, and Fis domain
MRQVTLVAASRSTVLITGETGTGKELVARAIHERSAQPRTPFVAVNCAALPGTLLESELFGHVRGAFTDATNSKRGKFALANGGSLLLDEIGTMEPGLQAKLLRVLQEREFEPLGSERSEHVDVRVMAATNRDLQERMNAGRFLPDLYYRLHVVPNAVPPLRERLEDIPLLVDHFVDKHAARMGRRIQGVEDGVVPLLQDYHWPGNVRELENAVERALVLTTGDTLRRDAFLLLTGAPAVRGSSLPSLNLHRNVQWAERETIRRALEASADKRCAARAMGISPRALSYYLAKYGAEVESAPAQRGSID